MDNAGSQRNGAGCTPSVIRGESPFHSGTPQNPCRDSGEILIDTLSFTIPIADVHTTYPKNGAGYDQSPLESIWTFLRQVLPFSLGEQADKGRNNFQHSRPFNDNHGFVAWGGNDSVPMPDGTIRTVPARFQVYISGEGCTQIQDWGRVADKLALFENLRITRLDIAYDDHEGSRTVDDAKQLYVEGAFTTSGRPPNSTYIDDMGSGNGCTLNVGNRANGKFLRVYEKGKQLGDALSRWVRWEIEFKSKHREIPLDALREPAAYLAGSYPALNWISAAREVIRTVREKAQVTVLHLVQCARTAYGKLLGLLHDKGGFSPDEIFNSLGVSGGVPARLNWAKSFNREELELCLT
ncbi:replication initiation factor domain-containing protein [Microbulbifer sp. DLAB2-AF]|uniref:replication initiation factor domain-containing protein n=1 Tax=Microbulbifer sp. DLAB2-AF TaxID=3243395 RepID=UPI004039E5BA